MIPWDQSGGDLEREPPDAGPIFPMRSPRAGPQASNTRIMESREYSQGRRLTSAHVVDGPVTRMPSSWQVFLFVANPCLGRVRLIANAGDTHCGGPRPGDAVAASRGIGPRSYRTYTYNGTKSVCSHGNYRGAIVYCKWALNASEWWGWEKMQRFSRCRESWVDGV